MGKRSQKYKIQVAKKPGAKQSAKRAAKLSAKSPAAPPNKSIKGSSPAKIGKSGRRWYTDAERCIVLTALKANGGNVAMTAAEQGVPYLTLYCWSKGRRCPEAMQLQSEYNERLELALNEVAWQAVAMMPQKMDKAPLNHLVLVLDKSIEKARLLRGESTSSADTRNTHLTQNADFARMSENFAKMPENERTEFKRLVAKLSGVVEPLHVGSGEVRGTLPGGPLPEDAGETSPLLD